MNFDPFIKMNTPGDFTNIVNCNCGDFRCKINKTNILNCKLKYWNDINNKILLEYHKNNTINNNLIENYIKFYKITIDIYNYIYKNREEEYIYEYKKNKELLKELLNYEYSSLINIITSKDEYYNEKNIVKKYHIDMSNLYDKLIIDKEYFNKLSNIIR